MIRLRCTRCSGSLGVWDKDRNEYCCRTCGHRYGNVDGILDLLAVEENGALPTPMPDQMSSFADPEPIGLGRLTPILDLLGGTLATERMPARQYAERTHVGKAGLQHFLDVGCGYGELLLAAASRYRPVIGVNVELEQLRTAQARLQANGIEHAILIRASAHNLPFEPRQFMAVACVEVLEHVGDPKVALSQLMLMLATDGRLYLSTPNRFTLRADPHTGLCGIGWMPRQLAEWWASLHGKSQELHSIHFFSCSSLSRLIEAEFSSNYRLIRSGRHATWRGRLAQRAWDKWPVSWLARWLVTDIEAVCWRA